MPPLLSHLFVQWEEAFEQGRELSPQELAADSPDLLGALCDGIEALKRMRQFGQPTAAFRAPSIPPSSGEQETTLLPSSSTALGKQVAPAGYEVLEELGRGGMGVVYRARQVSLSRVVALKMILAGGHAGPDERARFLLEAEAIARVKHPGIVQVHDYGTHDGLPYFSLELCEGGSLADRLRNGPLPPREAAEVVERVARAVQAAHEAGVVHRDLKPANILLTDRGEPRVSDFGLAKKADGANQTQTGAVLGTPSYMAPEQAQGKKDVGPFADVWALGAVLYTCLTGRPPFQAPTPLDTILQVIADDHVPVRRLSPQVPEDLETVCHKCLHKEPARRYSSAVALADDLKRWLEGRPIEARPVGQLERLGSWCRREPLTASLLSTVALLLIAGTAVAWGLAVWALGEKGRADSEAIAKETEARAARKAENTAREKEALATTREAQAKGNEALAKRREKAATFQALRAENARHAIQLDLALRAWRENDMARTEEILGGMAAPFLPEWETRYVRGLCQRRALPLVGHPNPIRAIAISPNGSHVASVCGEYQQLGNPPPGQVKVWNVLTGQQVLSFEGQAAALYAVAYSPDGQTIVAGGTGGTIRAWDARTGKLKHNRKAHAVNINALAYSPDGLSIASGSARTVVGGKEGPGEVKVWDARLGKVKFGLKGHTRDIAALCYSPDGKHIASASWDQSVRIWDAQTGGPIRTLKGHRDYASSVDYSPDGKCLVSTGGDGVLRAWDAGTGQEKLSIRMADSYTSSAAYSPDGERIVTGSHLVQVWDARTGRELLALKGHTAGGARVGFALAGQRIVSGAADNKLRVWDLEAASHGLSFRSHTAVVAAVSFSPDGRQVASAGDDDVLRVWDARTGQQRVVCAGHGGTVFALAYSRDGKRLVSGSWDMSVKTWDAATGKTIFTLGGHTGWVRAVAFSPDGLAVASGSRDRTVRVWGAHDGKLKFVIKGLAGEVNAVAYSPDGERILTGSGDMLDRQGPGELKAWDARTGMPLLAFKGHKNPVNAVAFSPDGAHVISSGFDGALRVWEARSAKEIQTLRVPSTAPVSVAYGPGGRRIVSGYEDGTLTVWDARTGQAKLTLAAHGRNTFGVAFSSDGSRIASCGADKQVKVWSAETIEGTTPPSPAWHASRAEEFEKQKRWPAAALHLERLYRHDPWVRPRLLAALEKADDSPLTRAARAGLQATDAARAAALVGRPLFPCP